MSEQVNGSPLDGETSRRLERWANWASEGGGYSSYVSPFAVIISQNVQRSGHSRPMPESDDEALETDRAIAVLKNKNRESYAAIIHFYIYRVSIRELGRRLGISKDKASNLIIHSVMWLEGFLESKVIHRAD